MIELFSKTREQIQADVSKYCSGQRSTVTGGPIKSTSGNLLIDLVKESLVSSPGGLGRKTDDLLESLRKGGMKKITQEDLTALSDPLLISIGDTWFWRDPGRTVYVYAPKSVTSLPGATKVKDTIWNCPITEDLLKSYREYGDQLMILDTDIQRIFDVLYTPAEKMEKELLSEFMSI